MVKIKASGVRYTDLHAAKEDWPIKPVLLLIPGCEGIREVIEVGKNIKHIKVGYLIWLPWLFSACGHLNDF
nr:alcohol dehydrogenase catalytic domain-containing protein [Spiroplasma tabanidicola]